MAEDNETVAHVPDGVSLVALLHVARDPSDPSAADAALGSLIERLYPLAERFLARRLTRFRDGADAAADAAQETMIRVATALDACRAVDDRQLVAWTLVTARRTLIDLYRSPSSGLAARALAVELDDALDAAEADGEFDPDTASTPRGTLLALAMQAYDALSTETAELLWWRLVRGAEWAEVAEQMSTTATGAKRRFQRAQGSLQRAVRKLVTDLPAPQRAHAEELVATYRGTEVLAREARGRPGAEEDAA